MHYLPLIPNPIGLLILGTVGYLLYKSGKKSGKQKTEKNKSVAEKPAKA